jgi:hypothetical protein
MVGGWPGGIWLLSDEFYSGNYHWIGIQESLPQPGGVCVGIAPLPKSKFTHNFATGLEFNG